MRILGPYDKRKSVSSQCFPLIANGHDTAKELGAILGYPAGEIHHHLRSHVRSGLLATTLQDPLSVVRLGGRRKYAFTARGQEYLNERKGASHGVV